MHLAVLSMRKFSLPNTLDEYCQPCLRLDDMHIAIVLKSGDFSKKQLNTNWRAEFDMNGMPRGSRNPLGHAAKVYKKAGDVDIYGDVLQDFDEGWFYLWHCGLHMLRWSNRIRLPTSSFLTT